MEHTNSISKELGKVFLMLIISSGESQSVFKNEGSWRPLLPIQDRSRNHDHSKTKNSWRGLKWNQGNVYLKGYITMSTTTVETTLVFMAGLYNSVLQKNSTASFLKITRMSHRWGKVVFEKEKFKITASEPQLICKTFQLAMLWIEVGLFHLGQDGSMLLMKQWKY